MNQISIRTAKIIDSKEIALLTPQLGYGITKDEIEHKLQNYSNLELILVAEEEIIIGWIHVSIVEPLESSRFVEIRGIVVDEKHRKRGIGSQLIKEAIEWGKSQNCSRIRVRTNIKREETIEYYKNIKFNIKKQQVVFEKEV